MAIRMDWTTGGNPERVATVGDIDTKRSRTLDKTRSRRQNDEQSSALRVERSGCAGFAV